MLTRAENKLVTEVGPATPLSEVMRRYWLPACLSEEIAKPDCPPIRVKLLGEELVAFRKSDGRIGLLEKYDLWVRPDGRRRILIQPRLECNWFQAMENSVNPSHLQVLDQTSIAGGRTITDTTRGLTDDVAEFDFHEFSHGIMKKRTYKNGNVDEHPVLFPNILRQSNATQIRVPIDDTQTKICFVRFDPSPDGSIPTVAMSMASFGLSSTSSPCGSSSPKD